MTHSPTRNTLIFSFALAILAALALAPASLAATSFCPPGSGTGQCSDPQGLATDFGTGRVYVADTGNNRVNVFESDGEFLFAVGWDVVSAGPGKVAAPDEQQTVTLGANTTGGSFELRFDTQLTEAFDEKFSEPIAFDAPASGPNSVEAALNALLSIGGVGGSVSVTGPNGGPYTVTFGGVYAGEGVSQMESNTVGLIVSGGEPSVNVTTAVPGGAFEICKAAAGDICKPGSRGAGAGQFGGAFSKPTRIVVDNTGGPEQGKVYVGTDNFRVQKFKPDGNFELAFGWGVDTGAPEPQVCTAASTCQAGTFPAPETPGGEIPAGECQLGRSSDPIAVGSGGDVFVADTIGNEPNFTNRVEKFSPAGACLGETLLVKGNFRLGALAVDSSEDAYVQVESAVGGFKKFDLGSPENELLHCDPGIFTRALAIDASGRLFAAQSESSATGVVFGSFPEITEYDTACNVIRRFGYGQIENSNMEGLAVLHGAEGDVFLAPGVSQHIRYLKIPPPGPIIAPESVEANPIGNTKATIKAEINPEGKASAYHVDFMTMEAFKEEDEEFTGEGLKSTPIKALDFSAGKEFRLRQAEAVLGCPVATQELIDEGKCLEPETEYAFRVIANNADNPSGAGEGTVQGSFTTEPSIDFGAVYATEVGLDTAKINAEVNPVGIPATGYFEYVDEATYQQSGFAEASRVPDTEAGLQPLDFGSAETFSARGVTLNPLTPGTTYRYRLAAINPFLEEPRTSAEGSFTTFEPLGAEPGSCPANEAFRAAASALLPDCRAYEMVSPLDKGGFDVVPQTQRVIGRPAAVEQSAVSGDRFTYGVRNPFDDAKSSPVTTQYMATRNPLGHPEEGWRNHTITPAYDKPIKALLELDYDFRAFSPDLCQSWATPYFEPVLAEGAIPGYINLYRRQDDACGGEAYEALTTTQPENLTGFQFDLEVQGVSADGTVAVFVADDNLSFDSPPQPAGCVNTGQGCQLRLYATAPGFPPRFLCVLPGGQASKSPCSAGTSSPNGFSLHRLANVSGAVSADGTRIFWSASDAEGKIYLRQNPFGEGAECSGAGSPCTIAVSKDAEALSKTSVSHFWAGANDGSRAIFSTGATGSGKGDLYEFEVEAEATHKIAGAVIGVLGASADASRTYFVSGEVLSEAANSEGEKAIAGKPNLYLYETEADVYRFIATLASADVSSQLSFGTSSATAFEPHFHNARVSASGLHVAFMSTAPLTGYDNTDALSGKADTEAFLYDAGEGQLICASCNPSGARPAGANVLGEEVIPFWVAAQIPVWQSTLYPGRVLAEDGTRLYFEAQDSLVARDTNGRLDVYQWEELGAGSCEESRPTFSPAAQGCIDLISSGQSLNNSTFVDASPDGRDVFIRTSSSLVPQDYGLIDIYDARVLGGFPGPPPPGPECEGGACQSPAPPPNDPTPASAGFRGPGDPVAIGAAKRRCPKGRRRVKVGGKGKTRCLKPRKARHAKKGGRPANRNRGGAK